MRLTATLDKCFFPLFRFSSTSVLSTLPPIATGISGDGSGTPDIGLTFPHPDGAAAEDGLILLRHPTDLEADQLAEEAEEEEVVAGVDVEEEEDSDEMVTSPQAQPLTNPPPGLGLILESMDSHLQHRMAFLRGRESSSGSQDSLLTAAAAPGDEVADEHSTGEALEDESNNPQRRLGRPPSPSAMPSSTDNLLWMHHQQQGLSTSAATSSSNHVVISPCDQSAVGEGDSRSDGEGEEGESEGPPRATASSSVDLSSGATPAAPHDVIGSGDVG